MSNTCSGDGRCFTDYGPKDPDPNVIIGPKMLWRKQKGYKNCPCELTECSRCGHKLPEFWTGCFGGYCRAECQMPQCFGLDKPDNK